MKYILLLLLIALPVSAAVQPFEAELPMTCGDSDNLLNGLRKKYNEEIIFMAPGVNANGQELFHSLWINSDTKTWTFVVVNKEQKITCVISSGENYRVFGPAMI